MSTYTVEFGAGFGSCTPRRDTVLSVTFSTSSKTVTGINRAAKKAAREAFMNAFGKDVDNYGLVFSSIDTEDGLNLRVDWDGTRFTD